MLLENSKRKKEEGKEEKKVQADLLGKGSFWKSVGKGTWKNTR